MLELGLIETVAAHCGWAETIGTNCWVKFAVNVEAPAGTVMLRLILPLSVHLENGYRELML